MKISEQLLKRINPFVIRLLKSRFHGLASKDLTLVTVTGRRSGRSYTRPVSYVQEGETVRCLSSTTTAWWKNVEGGATVSLRLRGTDVSGHGEVTRGEPKRIADALTAFLTRLPRDATYYDVALDANQIPVAADIERAADEVVLVEIALASHN